MFDNVTARDDNYPKYELLIIHIRNHLAKFMNLEASVGRFSTWPIMANFIAMEHFNHKCLSMTREHFYRWEHFLSFHRNDTGNIKGKISKNLNEWINETNIRINGRIPCKYDNLIITFMTDLVK